MAALRRPNARGQAVVEFVLIMNVLLIVLYAIYQLGTVFANYIEITDAARAAARKAASYGAGLTADATIEATSRSQAQASASSSLGKPVCNPPNAVASGCVAVVLTASPSWAAGNPVTATVQEPYSINILGLVVSQGVLSSSTTMRIEKRLFTP